MRTKYLHWYFIAMLVFSFETSWSAHLVGGEINYKCLGNNDYEITLIIYRDGMSSGAPFDQNIVLSIYDNNNLLVTSRYVPLLNITNLPLAAPNNCTSLPNNVATEKGIYKDTINLPPKIGGYTITHQRCCRNNTITNINNANSLWGSTYTTSIPSMDNCNSSPEFQGDPPVVLCVNQNVDLDLSAQEPDGDSLHYELCSPLHGGSNAPGNVMPDPANPPPYTQVPFLNGFSIQDPISSNPQFSIDPNTGILSGTPTQVGQFVFAICVSEYDSNGNKLSVTRRDFQFNVSNACKVILSRQKPPFGSVISYRDTATALNNPVSVCTGRMITFDSRSQFASTYFWDFGDTTILTDTSYFPNPTHIYSDTGSYLVTHIAEPSSQCADTSYALYEVYDSVKVKYEFDGELCFDSNNIDFSVSGNFSENTSFQWDFGGNTNQGTTSTQKEPKGVSWTEAGKHYVEVFIDDFSCTASFGDTVEIYPNPEIDEVVEQASICAPYTVQFKDQSTAYGRLQHFWFFGDGTMSNETNPTHTYLNPGTYTVEHVIRSFKGCQDSAYSKYTDVIEVFPVPESKLKLSTQEKTIYDPIFQIESQSTGHNSTLTLLPDGSEIENLERETITMEDTGNFDIVHMSFNKFGCADTLVKTIRVETPFNLHIPNAFTPNGDGINDLFRFTVTDVRSITFEVYNRWGEIVFQTNDMDATWNGRQQNSGEKLPPGIYSYVFIARVKSGGYDHVEKGTINLIR